MKTLLKWNNIRLLIGILLIIFTVYLYFYAVCNAEKLNSFENKISYINENTSTSLTGKVAYDNQKKEELLKDVGMTFLFWGQKDVSEVKNKELDTTVTTPIILTSGNTNLIFPTGKTLDYDTKNICLIGSHTANELFGGTDVEGLNIEYGEKEYVVHGVIDDVDDVFVISTSSEKDIGLNRYEVKYNSKNQMSGIINKSNELYSPGTIVEYDFMIFILDMLLIVIPIIVFISLLRSIVIESQHCKKENNVKGRAVWIVLSVLLSLGFVFFIGKYIDYPIDMIPAKWSDFDFWTRLTETKKDSLLLYFRQEKTPADMLFIIPWVKSIFLNLLGMTSIIIGNKLITEALYQRNVLIDKVEVKNV